MEIQRKCNMKCMITPVIIEATRMVTEDVKKNLKQYQENIQ
jgi:hypothetical protein